MGQSQPSRTIRQEWELAARAGVGKPVADEELFLLSCDSAAVYDWRRGWRNRSPFQAAHFDPVTLRNDETMLIVRDAEPQAETAKRFIRLKIQER